MDRDRSVKIQKELLSIIYDYLQNSFYSFEAGGIILGREDINSNNLIIDIITEPYKKDYRSRYKFVRKDQKHLKTYENENFRNNNIYMYVGEWHTHPEKIPHYSNIDKNNWERICKENIANPYQFHIIAGTEALSIWRISKNDCAIQLCYNELWNNLLEVNDEYKKN